MKVLGVEESAFHGLPYLDAGGRGVIERRQLPWVRGVVDALPEGIEALVVAADLQGRVQPGRLDAGGMPLLGVAVARELETLSALGELPELDRVGVLLAGDLFVHPALSKRGGLGDVGEVYEAFGARVRWVVGVRGNHDVIGPEDRAPRRWGREGIHVLEGTVEVDGLCVGGVGGIVGNPRKAQRRPEWDFYEAIEARLQARSEVLLLHQGPSVPPGVRGHDGVRELLEGRRRPLLTVCGHVHTETALARLGAGQVLNVDGRVVVLSARG